MSLRRRLLILCATMALFSGSAAAIVNGNLETGFAAVGALESDEGFWSSGVLIDPFWILTTANFVEHSSGATFHIGFDRTNPDESHSISAMFPHPSYDPSTLDNNIAVVRLTTPVMGASPLPYSTTSSGLSSGATARYVGYGWATVSDSGNTFRRSCLNTISSVYFDSFVTYDTATGPYFGDMGGPALLETGGLWRVAGVISTVAGGSLQFTSSTRVDAFDSFIANVIASAPPPITSVGHPPLAGLQLQVAPNPFNPTTMIHFVLPQAAYARIYVYDVAGRLVSSLEGDHFEPGRHELQWNALDDRGRALASGTYTLRLRAGPASITQKVTLLK